MVGSGSSFLIGANEVAGLNSISNAITGESLDVTSFGADVKSFVAGLVSGTINIAGFFTPSDTNGQKAIFTAQLARTTLPDCKFLTDGTNGFSADAIVTGFTTDTTPSGTVNFSATLQLTGTITVES